MSEPNSLFARIHITKDNFDKFLTSKPTAPKKDNDWWEWWNSKEMYEKIDLHEEKIYCYGNPTNQSIINSWKESKQSLTFSDYDEENEIGTSG